MKSVTLIHKDKRTFAEINLVSSKSISNRALCIRLWCDKPFEIKNLSTAADTATFNSITETFNANQTNQHTFDVGPAGTVMRFLTAYFASVPCDVILTGSDRMKQRPISILVDALKKLGADINYIEKEGYAPIHIKGKNLKGGALEIDGSVSSQYISALLMLAPKLAEGLTLKLTGAIASKSYISMTLSMMTYFGIKTKWNGDTISVEPQNYTSRRITIESDWSAASYWYAIAALSHDAKIKLKGLQETSWQGDSIIPELFDMLGVKTIYGNGIVELRKRPLDVAPKRFDYDFTNCPDIAQTLAIVLAAKNIPSTLSGLSTLKIKETNRLDALKIELQKFGIECLCTEVTLTLNSPHFTTNNNAEIATYDDHRMAMAFAPLALMQGSLKINDAEVVRKSYPTFYNDLYLAGFTIEEKIMKPAEVKIEKYNYDLPSQNIALFPLKQRDSSKLLVYNNAKITDSVFKNLPDEISSGTLLVFNNTKVVRARLVFANENGARIELFCLESADNIPVEVAMQQKGQATWKCLVGNLKRWKNKTIAITVKNLILTAEYVSNLNDSHQVNFTWNSDQSFYELLEELGKIPLPPYLKRDEEISDTDNYQTVYAKISGSVAAPTAGLHFTDNLLNKLQEKKIQQGYITLHVGAGTFMPVKTDTIAEHEMHAEEISVTKHFIEQLKNQSEPILPVGTTSLRCLESLYWLGVKYAINNADSNSGLSLSQWECYNLDASHSNKEVLIALLNWMEVKKLESITAKTKLIIVPNYNFKLASGIITNFHQPCSTLLLIVAAMVGTENWKTIYKHALEKQYRFLSFGDGSLLWRNMTTTQ